MSDEANIVFAAIGPPIGAAIGLAVSLWLAVQRDKMNQPRPQRTEKDYGGRVPTAQEWYNEQFEK